MMLFIFILGPLGFGLAYLAGRSPVAASLAADVVLQLAVALFHHVRPGLEPEDLARHFPGRKLYLMTYEPEGEPIRIRPLAVPVVTP